MFDFEDPDSFKHSVQTVKHEKLACQTFKLRQRDARSDPQMCIVVVESAYLAYDGNGLAQPAFYKSGSVSNPNLHV